MPKDRRYSKNNPTYFQTTFVGVFKYSWRCKECGRKNQQLNNKNQAYIRCKFCGAKLNIAENLGYIGREEKEDG